MVSVLTNVLSSHKTFQKGLVCSRTYLTQCSRQRQQCSWQWCGFTNRHLTWSWREMKDDESKWLIWNTDNSPEGTCIYLNYQVYTYLGLPLGAEFPPFGGKTIFPSCSLSCRRFFLQTAFFHFNALKPPHSSKEIHDLLLLLFISLQSALISCFSIKVCLFLLPLAFAGMMQWCSKGSRHNQPPTSHLCGRCSSKFWGHEKVDKKLSKSHRWFVASFRRFFFRHLGVFFGRILYESLQFLFSIKPWKILTSKRLIPKKVKHYTQAHDAKNEGQTKEVWVAQHATQFSGLEQENLRFVQRMDFNEENWNNIFQNCSNPIAFFQRNSFFQSPFFFWILSIGRNYAYPGSLGIFILWQ